MDDAARELAEKQQLRIEHPSAVSPRAVVEDVELQLDDPALDLPVYWLGRSFDPKGPLPRLGLAFATVGGAGPGQSVHLWYGNVMVDTWQPAAWNRFRRTRLGRLIWDSPCARKTLVRAPAGRAEIFQGYGAPKPIGRPCPTRRPDRVIAHVYFDDVVIAVDMPYCYMCARAGSRRGSYETVEAMEMLVRSLRLRTPHP